MKQIISTFIASAIIAAAITANAGFLVTDSNATKVQGFAPNGLASALLTVNSVTYDMTASYVAFSVYSPADCKIRIMKTADKTGTISETVVGGQWSTLVVNPNTAFINLSGCASGMLRRQ